jgi:bifunctional non-homologous end joining protein LigD
MRRTAKSRSPARASGKQVKGARRAPYPGFVTPCLATLKPNVPEGPRWVYEIKYDGYRVQAHLKHGEPAIYTRAGHDWSRRFKPIAFALAKLQAKYLIADGEVVVNDSQGVPDFASLHADLAAGRTDRLLYYAFDLLYIDGFDLRASPLLERKRVLAQLLGGAHVGPILFSDHLKGEGSAIFKRACEMRLEGVISKRTDAPYRSGRGESWIKTKCIKRDAFPIVAFVEKLDANPRRIASLYLGRWAGQKLLYAGKAQTGFTDKALHEIREHLDPLIIRECPLDEAVKKPKATWVKPFVEAEVEYSSMTADGRLRAPVFKALKEADVSEPPQPKSVIELRNKRKKTIRGVPKENILQLLPEAVAPSKEELAAYWRRVWKPALKHLAHRPLKLVRHVHGITFYHMGPLPPVPSSVRQIRLKKREGSTGTRLWIEDLEGLLGLVEIGVVELHPWNATVEDIEHADRLVFDLDPGEGVTWEFVCDTAFELRSLFKAEGLTSWPKVTGGKGLHVMVPVEAEMTHDEAHDYCRGVAERLASTNGRYTISAQGSRAGLLFIDYLRNGRGTTAIGAYSPRARPRFPVAMPVSWKDVEGGVLPDAFKLRRGRRTRAHSMTRVTGAVSADGRRLASPGSKPR